MTINTFLHSDTLQPPLLIMTAKIYKSDCTILLMIVYRGVSETTSPERHHASATASVKGLVGRGTPEAVMNRPTETYTDRRRRTVIYSTAKHYNAILLTEDKTLLKIVQSHSEYSLRAVNWESLVRNL